MFHNRVFGSVNNGKLLLFLLLFENVILEIRKELQI